MFSSYPPGLHPDHAYTIDWPLILSLLPCPKQAVCAALLVGVCKHEHERQRERQREEKGCLSIKQTATQQRGCCRSAAGHSGFSGGTTHTCSLTFFLPPTCGISSLSVFWHLLMYTLFILILGYGTLQDARDSLFSFGPSAPPRILFPIPMQPSTSNLQSPPRLTWLTLSRAGR